MGLPCNIVLACLLIGSVTAAPLKSFYKHEIVPGVIPFAPKAVLSIILLKSNYRESPLDFRLAMASLTTGIVVWTKTGAIVNEGNVLLNSQMQEIPDIVQWNSDPDKHYTILMSEPDAPSRSDPSLSEICHWALVNIPGGDIGRGLTLAPYFGPVGVPGTGLHRYIFLVYEQPQGYIDPEVFADSEITGPYAPRTHWSMLQFAKKYELSGPIAGNFFQSEWLD